MQMRLTWNPQLKLDSTQNLGILPSQKSSTVPPARSHFFVSSKYPSFESRSNAPTGDSRLIRLRIVGLIRVICFIGVIGLIFAATNIEAQDSKTEIAKSTATPGFTYKAKHLRDPFIALIGAGGAVNIQPTSGNDALTPPTAEEVEAGFESAELELEALLSDSGKNSTMAIVGNANNKTQRYLIKGNTIRHMASGIDIKSYEATISDQIVVVTQLQGGQQKSIIKFPDKEEKR